MSLQKELDNIYVNIVIDHTNNSNAPQVAEYSNTKSSPIVGRASDYYMSVVRFDIPLSALPLFIMPIIPNTSTGPNDPGLYNKTPFIVGISYNNAQTSENLTYNSQGLLPFPSQNQPSQVITPYYYVYDYQILIDMINTSILNVYNAQGFQTMFPDVIPPHFFYDSPTSLLKLYIPSFFTKIVSPLTSVPVIYVNAQLIEYFDAFPVFFNGYDQPNGFDFYYIATNVQDCQAYERFGTIYPPYSGTPPALQFITPDYYVITQEYSTTTYWISLRKILLISNSLPVANEYISNYGNSTASNNPALPIITDFVPNIQSGFEGRSIAYYAPTGQYRLIDLISDSPIRKIDIKIYWEDKSGNIFPLEISYFEEVNIKIGFFRKSLYKPTGLLKM
jgi:hypothetical protein